MFLGLNEKKCLYIFVVLDTQVVNFSIREEYREKFRARSAVEK